MDPKDVRILNYKSPDGSLKPVTQLIFDLDNTLYPAASGLAGEMHTRMTDFVSQHLGLPREEAELLRQSGFQVHGTTLRWLQHEQGLVDAGAFLGYVHPENVADFLHPLPKLRSFLKSLMLPKSILTNAPRNHAERVLEFYGISDCFDHIFDLEWNKYEGKPHQGAYERSLEALRSPIASTVFIDDVPAYLKTFDTLGGLCILVDETNQHTTSLWPRISSIFDLGQVLV